MACRRKRRPQGDGDTRAAPGWQRFAASVRFRETSGRTIRCMPERKRRQDGSISRKGDSAFPVSRLLSRAGRRGDHGRLLCRQPIRLPAIPQPCGTAGRHRCNCRLHAFLERPSVHGQRLLPVHRHCVPFRGHPRPDERSGVAGSHRIPPRERRCIDPVVDRQPMACRLVLSRCAAIAPPTAHADRHPARVLHGSSSRVLPRVLRVSSPIRIFPARV